MLFPTPTPQTKIKKTLANDFLNGFAIKYYTVDKLHFQI